MCLNPCFSGTYSRRRGQSVGVKAKRVLILVLVEHTLGGTACVLSHETLLVLILVLVEHTLGAVPHHWGPDLGKVLILVLVEHTLGAATAAAISSCR